MDTTIQKIKALREATQKLPPFTKWDNIHENEIYLVPPISSLERKMIQVVYKDDDVLRYVNMSDAARTMREMYKTSLSSKFIVKLHKF